MTSSTVVLLVVAINTMLTGAATVTYCAIPKYQIAFPKSSDLPRGFITQDGGNITVTQSHVIPTFYLFIQDSFGNQQYDYGPTVSVTAVGAAVNTGGEDQYMQLTGATTTGYNGLITFSTLFLERGPRDATTFRLRFKVTVTDPSATDPIANYVLISPPINFVPSQVSAHHIAIYPAASALQYLGQPQFFVPGQPMLPMRVAVMNSYGSVNSALTSQGAERNFTFYIDFAYPPPVAATISGNSAIALRGIATFSNVVITSPSATVGQVFPPLVITCPDLCCEQPFTGKLTAKALVEYDLLAFQTADQSAVWYDGQVITGVNDVALPTIRVVLTNTIGASSPATTGLVLTANITSSTPDLEGGVVGIVNGAAEFSLVFHKCRTSTPQPYVITITASNQYGSVNGESLRFVVMFSTNTYPASLMRFRPSSVYSFFTREDQLAVITNNYASLPIDVELLDSAYSSSNASGVSITAYLYNTAEGQSQLDAANFVDGRASFPSLYVPTPTNVKGTTPVIVLLFVATATSALGYGVTGQVLQTGLVTITTEILAYDIRFEGTGNSHFSQSGQTSFATVNVALPTIVVLMTTSGGSVDATSSGVGITATASGGALLSNNFARTANGLAVFSSLTFVSDATGKFVITFTVSSDSSVAAAGKSIATGSVTLVSTVTANYAPWFAPGSYVEFPNQVVSVTLGYTVPAITISLVDSSHEQPVDVSDPAPFLNTVVTVTAVSGTIFENSTVKVSVGLGFATFHDLVIMSGLDAVLQFCVSGGTTAAAGKCISTGPIAGHSALYNASGLAILGTKGTLLQPSHQDITVNRGGYLTALLALVDSAGYAVVAGSAIPSTQVLASSNYLLTGTTQQSVNTSDGTVYFGDLKFSTDVSVGVTPYITFSIYATATQTAQLLLRPVTSGLITVSNGAAQVLSGVDVVAEVLQDLSTFSVDTWIATLAKVMNVETARFSVTYVYAGKSGANEATTFDPVQGNFVAPSWEGVRVEFRTLPPLQTSVDTRTPQQLAAFITNMQPGCGGVQALYLRQAYLKNSDTSCDWLIFDNQMNGVRSCVQARGKEGYCDCYGPLMTTLGPRCIGLERLSDLCLNILVSSQSANCKNPSVVQICTYFEYPDASRDGLMISGTVLLFVWIYLAYAYSKHYFHGLGPTQQITTLSLPAAGNAYETFL